MHNNKLVNHAFLDHSWRRELIALSKLKISCWINDMEGQTIGCAGCVEYWPSFLNKKEMMAQNSFHANNCKASIVTTRMMLFRRVLLCLAVLHQTTGDSSTTFPVLNICCPHGSRYDSVNDNCTESRSTEGIITSESSIVVKPPLNASERTNPIDVHGTDYEDAYISIPRSLVIQFKKEHENQTEFKFLSNVSFPSTACTLGRFLLDFPTKEVVPQGNNAETSQSNKTNSNRQGIIGFTYDGKLRINNDYYSSPEFCIAAFGDKTVTVRVCNPTCSGETPCIRKCCPLDQVWNMKRGKPGKKECAPAGEITWEPDFYKSPKTKATDEERRAVYSHYLIVHPKRFCNKLALPTAIEHRDGAGRTYWKYRISLKGNQFRKSGKSRYTWFDKEASETYCIDGLINSQFWQGDNQTGYSGLSQDEILIECLPKKEAASRKQSKLYGSLLIVSSIFLVLTIVVQLLIVDRQPNRTWSYTLISYCLSLFGFYISLIVVHFSSFYTVRRSVDDIKTYCYNIGVVFHFFFISTFCWMSAVNYDIFRTFKVLKPTVGRTKGLSRYLSYAAFSLAVPITIVVIAVVLDNLYRLDYESEVIIPEYGKNTCSLDIEYAQLAYAYGPAGVLLIFNVTCFVVTIYTMHSIRKSTKFATATSSKKRQQQQSFKLFAKLVFVMGFTWIFEIISWFSQKGQSEVQWYWVVFDLLNIFQALAIFWIFVCKPDVTYHLEQKFPWFRRLLDRVMVSKESAQRIVTRHPELKHIIKPFTRGGKKEAEATSTARSVPTDGTDASLAITSTTVGNGVELDAVKKKSEMT